MSDEKLPESLDWNAKLATTAQSASVTVLARSLALRAERLEAGTPAPAFNSSI